MAATAAAVSAAEAEREELRGLLHKKYRWLDYKFDLVFWITAAFVVGAGALALGLAASFVLVPKSKA